MISVRALVASDPAEGGHKQPATKVRTQIARAIHGALDLAPTPHFTLQVMQLLIWATCIESRGQDSVGLRGVRIGQPNASRFDR
jgi:hypothetical protein